MRTNILPPVYHRHPAQASTPDGGHSSPDDKIGGFLAHFCKLPPGMVMQANVVDLSLMSNQGQVLLLRNHLQNHLLVSSLVLACVHAIRALVQTKTRQASAAGASNLAPTRPRSHLLGAYRLKRMKKVYSARSALGRDRHPRVPSHQTRRAPSRLRPNIPRSPLHWYCSRCRRHRNDLRAPVHT